jgi:hypothetical protein
MPTWRPGRVREMTSQMIDPIIRAKRISPMMLNQRGKPTPP